MSNISILFFSVILEGFPYILLGAMISAAIEVFVPAEIIKRYAGKNNLPTIIYFGLLGFILPVCECGIAPVAARLRRKGVQTGPMLAYLLSAPAFQPIVMFSTYSAFNNNWKISAMRCGISLFIAVAIAFLLRNIQPLKDNNEIENQIHQHNHDHSNTNADDCDCHSCGGEHHSDIYDENTADHLHSQEHTHTHSQLHPHLHSHSHSRQQISKFSEFVAVFIKEFAVITAYLAIGALAASLLSYYNPVDIYGAAGKNIVGIIIMMCMAVALSVCSEADAFVAYSFAGFDISAKLAFMWLGPVLDIKLMLMYSKIFTRKFMILTFGTAILLVFICALIMSYFTNLLV